MNNTVEGIENDTRRDSIAGLRALADWLEAHPQIPAPSDQTLLNYVFTREELAAVARVGGWGKIYEGDYFTLERAFGPLKYHVYTNRAQVCRRVVRGQRVVPAQPERTEDVVEWVCEEPSLLAREASHDH